MLVNFLLPPLASFQSGADPLPHLAAPSTSKKSTASRRPRSGDAAYRPSATSDVSSEEDSEEGMTHRRRKSKGKGRASAGGSSQAIPIGRRDNEVWYGKKRKGRKGSRRPSGGEGGKDGEEEEEQDLGGMSHQDFTFDRSDEQQQQEDDDSTPAPEPTTFFLRPKSPPARRSVSPGAHSPFQPSRTQDRSPSTSVDPQIAAFDRSLGGASTSNSNSNDYSHSFNFSLAALEQRDRSGRSPSVDASILSVQNSYDYREEEEIVKALEAQKRASGGSLAGAGAGVGPSPSKSAAGSRRRMPGPPGGLQEMTIEEEGEGSRAGGAPAQEKQAGGAGGEFGSRLGKGVRPLWAGLGVCWNWARNPLLDWAKIGKAVGLLLLLVWALSALR